MTRLELRSRGGAGVVSADWRSGHGGTRI